MTKFSITKERLKSEDIKFLKNKKALYISDFRAISESMNYKIPAMWKYENLFPWILNNQNVVVNEDSNNLNYLNKNNLISIPKNDDSRKSIFERIESKISKGTLYLVVAVPHPQADLLAQKYNLKLNYNYLDFLIKNDKFKQKELLEKLTPKWFKIKSQKEIDFLLIEGHEGFIKRRQGSGGFTVFNILEIRNSKNFQMLFKNNPLDWYFEDCVDGKPCSVQCVKEKKDIFIFGFSEQQIINGHYFVGSKILPIDGIDENLFQTLKECLNKLSPLLDDYEGFFGIDFIINNKNNLQILEANIRMTAATIPTLITNDLEYNGALFMEDIRLNETKDNDLILTRYDNEVDFIRPLNI
jgi:predicted ATP-grasp superfamily ATP-dependent carboligase